MALERRGKRRRGGIPHRLMSSVYNRSYSSIKIKPNYDIGSQRTCGVGRIRYQSGDGGKIGLFLIHNTNFLWEFVYREPMSRRRRVGLIGYNTRSVSNIDCVLISTTAYIWGCVYKSTNDLGGKRRRYVSFRLSPHYSNPIYLWEFVYQSTRNLAKKRRYYADMIAEV